MKDVVRIVLTVIIYSLLLYTEYSLPFEEWWAKGARVIVQPDKTLKQSWARKVFITFATKLIPNK